MEHDVNFKFKKEVYSELELCIKDKDGKHHSERFNADLVEYIVVLPLKPKIEFFEWITSSISHEYLHLILTEFESFESGAKLDNLGYNLASGCTEIKGIKR